jgi:hypothetical protein
VGFISRFLPRRGAGRQIDALLRDAVRAPGGRAAFYRALLDETLFVPGETVEGELFIRPYEIDGRSTLLFFSSGERLSEALADAPSRIELPGRALLGVANVFDRVILDYGSSTAKEFTHSEIEAVLTGAVFELAEEETGQGMVVGQPKKYPVRLMDLLRQGLPTRPDVRAAYIAQVYEIESGEEPRVVIAFDTAMSEEELALFFDRVRDLAETNGAPDVRFTRLAEDGLGEYLRSEVTPFYSVGE